MAYSDQDILGKIGDLLVEINEQYASLDKSSLADHKVDVLLLGAQAKYLAAHLDALASLQGKERVNIGGAVQESSSAITSEEVFTPAVAHEDHESDNQPVEEEIQEVEAVQTEVEEQEVPEIEEYQEEETENSGYSVDSNEEGEVTKVTQNVELKDIEIDDTQWERPEANEPVEKEEVSGFKDFNISSNPVHTASSDYTSVASAEEAEAEKEEQKEVVSNEPIVNEVVIEQKEVEIEAEKEPEPEVSLNDLAKQAEVKPSRPLTLNELIQQQKKAGLTNANQFNTSQDRSSDRIGDLKIAVSLNDKLLFIKDLFNGYSLAYSEAIELLNRFDNFAEADAFLQSNYSLKNNWAAKPQTVDKLYAILRKKYI